MKALLFAAALAIPVAASADDPNRYGGARSQGDTTQQPGTLNEAGAPTQSGTQMDSDSSQAFSKDEVFSKDMVVQKINKVGQKHIELGNLAKSRASSDDVRRFGNKLVKDSESLTKAVSKYAKDNKIELSAAPYLGGSKDMSGSGSISGSSNTGAGIESSGSPARTGTMGGTGTDDTIAGSDVNMGSGSDKPAANTGSESSDKYGQTGSGEDFQQKLSELRSLQGTEFDSQFLSNVIEGSERALTRLQGWKGQGDKGLDRLIERAVKTIGDHQREALRLQGKVPAA